MAERRIISWEGFHNARDLGGLRTAGGRTTRYGALIRSGDVRFVTAARRFRPKGMITYFWDEGSGERPSHEGSGERPST